MGGSPPRPRRKSPAREPGHGQAPEAYGAPPWPYRSPRQRGPGSNPKREQPQPPETQGRARGATGKVVRPQRGGHRGPRQTHISCVLSFPVKSGDRGKTRRREQTQREEASTGDGKKRKTKEKGRKKEGKDKQGKKTKERGRERSQRHPPRGDKKACGTPAARSPALRPSDHQSCPPPGASPHSSHTVRVVGRGQQHQEGGQGLRQVAKVRQPLPVLPVVLLRANVTALRSRRASAPAATVRPASPDLPCPHHCPAGSALTDRTSVAASGPKSQCSGRPRTHRDTGHQRGSAGNHGEKLSAALAETHADTAHTTTQPRGQTHTDTDTRTRGSSSSPGVRKDSFQSPLMDSTA